MSDLPKDADERGKRAAAAISAYVVIVASRIAHGPMFVISDSERNAYHEMEKALTLQESDADA